MTKKEWIKQKVQLLSFTFDIVYENWDLLQFKVFYCLLYNLPKFFEFKTICPIIQNENMTDRETYEKNSTFFQESNCTIQELQIASRDIRYCKNQEVWI